MRLNGRAVEDTGFIDISGNLSTFVGENLYLLAEELIAKGCKKLCLDFSQCPYINSLGFASLIVLNTKLSKTAGVEVTAHGLTPHFVKIFVMTGLSDYIKPSDVNVENHK